MTYDLDRLEELEKAAIQPKSRFKTLEEARAWREAANDWDTELKAAAPALLATARKYEEMAKLMREIVTNSINDDSPCPFCRSVTSQLAALVGKEP